MSIWRTLPEVLSGSPPLKHMTGSEHRIPRTDVHILGSNPKRIVTSERDLSTGRSTHLESR